MAVNKVVYDGETLIDLTGDTVTPDSLAEGVTAHAASGAPITGTLTAVQYGKSQLLNDSQKAQARTNIGAASSEELDRLSEVIDEIGTQEDIVQAVIAALGTPVFGTVDENNNIVLTGELADGTYTVMYEDAEGNTSEIGDIVISSGPAYTNQLPISTDANGALVNGGKGYLENTRLSSSGITTLADAETTGYIPFNYGDVLRGSAGICGTSGVAVATLATPVKIEFSDSTKTRIGSIWNAADSGAANMAAMGRYGLVIASDGSFVFNSATANGANGAVPSNTAFVRISLYGIDTSSIMTVNEEIV